MRPPSPPSPQQLQRQVDAWNTAHPGTAVPVIVTLDDHSEVKTRTRSAAQILGGHSAVILLEDIVGFYALRRVRFNPPSIAS